MHRWRMERPTDMGKYLVVAYRGCWLLIDRRYPIKGETVLAYAPNPGDGALLVGTYDGTSISDGSETWTSAIIRGVVVATRPIADDGKGVAT